MQHSTSKNGKMHEIFKCFHSQWLKSVGPVVLPFFIILKSFQNLISSDQFTGRSTFSQLWRCSMCSYSALSPCTFVISPSLDHFIPAFSDLHLWHNLLPLYPAWILPFVLYPCRHSSFLLYSPTHYQALAWSLPVQEQHFFLHFILPLNTYPDHLLFWFYAIFYSIFFSPQ